MLLSLPCLFPQPLDQLGRGVSRLWEPLVSLFAEHEEIVTHGGRLRVKSGRSRLLDDTAGLVLRDLDEAAERVHHPHLLDGAAANLE